MQNSTRNHTAGIADLKKDQRYHMIANFQKKCLSENETHSSILSDDYDEDGMWCPRTFDGFACWDETPASNSAYQSYPGFILGFDPQRIVYKRCMENGTWDTNPITHKPWTNYNTCVDYEDLKFRTIINYIYVAGYSLSVVALFLSIMTFLYFRSLQCMRIRIHIQLFTSIALNNLLWIVWYRAVVVEVDVILENEIWCQFLHIVTIYFMVTSYIWMFCESLHLHMALVIVFIKEDVAMRWFIALGWVASLIIVMIYAVVRYYIPGSTERCWMDVSNTFWIVITPIGLTLVASFVFLLSVVRVLLTRVHTARSQRMSVSVKKAARAVVVLIPLFGLHFILLPLRPFTNAPEEQIYQVIAAILTSLQGFCIAVLFCFTNQDVLKAVKARIARFHRINEALAMTGNTR